jgi:hypothetical protein
MGGSGMIKLHTPFTTWCMTSVLGAAKVALLQEATRLALKAQLVGPVNIASGTAAFCGQVYHQPVQTVLLISKPWFYHLYLLPPLVGHRLFSPVFLRSALSDL